MFLPYIGASLPAASRFFLTTSYYLHPYTHQGSSAWKLLYNNHLSLITSPVQIRMNGSAEEQEGPVVSRATRKGVRIRTQQAELQVGSPPPKTQGGINVDLG